MRTKLLAFLLITSFVLGSFPFAKAQEVTEPAPEPEVVDTVPTPEPETVIETEPEPEPDPIAEPDTIIEDAPTEMAAPEVPVLEETPSVSLVVRYGENVAWSGTVPLPESGTVSITPTGESTGIDVDADSLLSVLLNVDAGSDDFEVSDLDYFPSFGSFLVNCIDATSFGHACGQWQYVVSGVYPFVGIDDYVLHDGDQVFVYFGSPRRALLNDTDIHVGESFTATAQSYDPASNAYDPLPGYTIGITQPDPANPWSPIEVATSTSGADGIATFALAAEGTYDIGLKEDFYFPSTSFTVSSSTDSGSGSGDSTDTGFNVPAAYDFLDHGQRSDGSWNSPLATDWSAIALAMPNAPSGMKSALASYLRTKETSVSSIPDHERHAMALMALGINPYTGGPHDYVTPIVESFDGTQIDKTEEVNDDIFGLMVLLHAGYGRNDTMIKDIVSFIVDDQQGDGAWKGSIDMTAAAIQALAQVRSLPGVKDAINEGEAFLHSEQDIDGGFGDPSATSWVLQAIAALGDSPSAWSVGGKTPLTYLAQTQNDDGGMEAPLNPSYDNRAWVTAYAIPAAKGVTWDSVLKDFEKPAMASGGSQSEDEEATTTDETVSIARPDEALIEPYVATSTIATVDDVDVPVEVVAPTLAVVDETIDEPAAPADTASSDLTAAALDSGAWEHIKGFFSSFWSFLKNLFS